MKKVFCDVCKRELPDNFIGEAYGYDCCFKKKCLEKIRREVEDA